jgi:hypothetical protein
MSIARWFKGANARRIVVAVSGSCDVRGFACTGIIIQSEIPTLEDWVERLSHFEVVEVD